MTLAPSSVPNIPRSYRKRIQSLSAFAISVCAHSALMLTMSFLVFLGQGNSFHGMSLLMSDADDADSESLTQLELNATLPTTDSESSAPQSPSTDATPITDPSTANALPFMPFADGPLASSNSALEETAIAMLSGGGFDGTSEGTTSTPIQAGKGPGASFFGTYAEGQKFVFVIDSSGSMKQGIRWPTLRRELLRALQSLSPDQQFMVISFDADAHPMFGKFPPQAQFLTATPSNIDRLNRWVGAIRHGNRTYPAAAIGIALRLKPDAIFLLSDGEIMDTTVRDLQKHNHLLETDGKVKTLIPIHTILLHSEYGYATLKAIADENDGVFTPVTVFPLNQ
jgi:hypothetical protein